METKVNKNVSIQNFFAIFFNFFIDVLYLLKINTSKSFGCLYVNKLGEIVEKTVENIIFVYTCVQLFFSKGSHIRTKKVKNMWQ